MQLNKSGGWHWMNDYNKGRLKRTQELIKKGTEFKKALQLMKERGITHIVIESDDKEIEYNVISVGKFIEEINHELEELEDTERHICSREHLKQRGTVEGDWVG